MPKSIQSPKLSAGFGARCQPGYLARKIEKIENNENDFKERKIELNKGRIRGGPCEGRRVRGSLAVGIKVEDFSNGMQTKHKFLFK